ncbi:hydrolase [Glaesserella sp.]|uniref:hydrolase n=1 Tax=Glaesserella sp. TaxID=2094731 RepID=UPI0035A023C1
MSLTSPNAHIFFIGGAADQEPYYLIGPLRHINLARQKFLLSLQKEFGSTERIFIHTYGYNRIYRPEDIEKNVIAKLKPTDYIYLIGHSLGGWNAAHLSRILRDNGFRVRILVTLDPVGEGTLVWLGSNIHRHPQSEPHADFWINIRAEIKRLTISDVVARAGQQWTIKQGPDLNEVIYTAHANALHLFRQKLSTGLSAMDYILQNLKQNLPLVSA